MRNFLVSALLFLASNMALASTVLNPERTIVIDGPITGSIVTPVIKTLNKLASKDKEAPIDIVISSPGGSLVAGYLIVDRMEALRAEGVTFRCVVRSLAASMAFQLLLHCDERYATPHAFLLWHPVRVFFQGVLTSDMARVAGKQMALSDKMIKAELYKALHIPTHVVDWHFTNETLHHATQLNKLAPGFFVEVTSNIANAFLNDDVALNTARFGGSFLDQTDIQYIHEQFVKKVEVTK